MSVILIVAVICVPLKEIGSDIFEDLLVTSTPLISTLLPVLFGNAAIVNEGYVVDKLPFTVCAVLSTVKLPSFVVPFPYKVTVPNLTSLSNGCKVN